MHHRNNITTFIYIAIVFDNFFTYAFYIRLFAYYIIHFYATSDGLQPKSLRETSWFFYFYLLSVIKRDLFCSHMFWTVFHFRRSRFATAPTFVFRALKSITLTELIFINLSLENSFKAVLCIKVVKIIGS